MALPSWLMAERPLPSRTGPELTDRFQTAVRVEKDFLNDTLSLTAVALTYGVTGQDGAIQRFTLAYDVTDAVRMTTGLVLYQSGDRAAFQNIGDNDRLYLEFKYSF